MVINYFLRLFFEIETANQINKNRGNGHLRNLQLRFLCVLLIALLQIKTLPSSTIAILH